MKTKETTSYTVQWNHLHIEFEDMRHYPKDYLIPGRIVLFRGGLYGLVIQTEEMIFIALPYQYFSIEDFNNDLKHCKYFDCDIMKVFDPIEPFSLTDLCEKQVSMKLVWERDSNTMKFYNKQNVTMVNDEEGIVIPKSTYEKMRNQLKYYELQQELLKCVDV